MGLATRPLENAPSRRREALSIPELIAGLGLGSTGIPACALCQ
jgi:hypothetical protein